jgi:hypothetical protein
LAERDEKLTSRSEAMWLCVGVFTGPVIWALQMQIGYMLVRGACASDSNLALHIVTVVALILVAGGAFISWRNWRQAGRQQPGGKAGGPCARSNFMAVLGLSTSAMFFIAILAQGIASFVLHPCQP